MLDKERIRLMTKMAAYENTLAPDDLKISSYYKKDYSSLNTLITAIWVTIGYAIAAGLVILCNVDAMLKDLTVAKLIIIAAVVVGAYIILLVAYCVCASSFYKSKHNKAKLLPGFIPPGKDVYEGEKIKYEYFTCLERATAKNICEVFHIYNESITIYFRTLCLRPD